MDATAQGKSVNIEGFDVYGQLIIWIISVCIFFKMGFDIGFLKNDGWILAVFYHAVGLLVLGAWQTYSSIVYLLRIQGKNAERTFFRNNILTGILLVILFAIIVYVLSNIEDSKAKQMAGTSIICVYFLIIHILSIRYWLHIKKLYSLRDKK